MWSSAILASIVWAARGQNAAFSFNVAFLIDPNHQAICVQPLLPLPHGIFIHGADDWLAPEKDVVGIHARTALAQLHRFWRAHQHVPPTHNKIAAVHIV